MLFLAVLVPLLQLAAAAPAPGPATTAELILPDDFNSTGTEVLEKRQGDGSGIHLVNCDRLINEGGVTPQRSLAVYCPNDRDCNKRPTTNNYCIMSVGRENIWKGSAQGCTFPTGVRFGWWIRPDAQQRPNYSKVGDGGNGIRGLHWL